MMYARFKLHEDANGEWHWTLIADNGEPVAQGTEGYRDKRDAIRGAFAAAEAAALAVTGRTVDLVRVDVDGETAEVTR